eukprot:TRINITY_DN5114_c0_g1_i1.p1 TRINITY_DN5114_c0_g1~~TRINITY_DN5114_c0_g1_i1.p1  ORF type:complete len:916 (+),score=220.62 TRINITY_DN5114_c0_g1_i1:318-2750(+)
MEERRLKRRQEREKQELIESRAKRPKIQSMFADIAKDLGTVSVDDWEKMTEIGDRSLRYKQASKYDKFTPAPDILLQQASSSTSYTGAATVDPAMSGVSTAISGTMTDLNAFGGARTSVLKTKLAAVADSVQGQAQADRDGLLTAINSQRVQTDAEIGDIKKARELFGSVTLSNPHHAPGWIAYARLEEAAGKIQKARKIIEEACDKCPKNQDIWLEAARMHAPQEAKTLLARAVEHLPENVQIWLAAARLETEDKNRKRRVLRKALEQIPNSAALWKEAIDLEEPDAARILLSRAVECVPQSSQMWLALARLETYTNAKKVLNRAINALPADKTIWISAAQLEEANGQLAKVPQIIHAAMDTLGKLGVKIDRDEWLGEAERCEKSGNPVVCQAIVHEAISLGVEEIDRKKTWKEDAKQCLARGSVATARAIYAEATEAFPGKPGFWLKLADLEKKHGTKESVDDVLKQAVKFCPKAEELWLRAAKEQWMSGNVDGARAIIKEAYAANPDSEAIWLAAVKLEKENNEFERARVLLERARNTASTAKVWMKSALLEREAGASASERAILEEAVTKFPDFEKLWLMLAQLDEREQKNEAALKTYMTALKTLPTSVPLWLGAARLEERTAGAAKCRALLEKGRLRLLGQEGLATLWLESFRVEMRCGNTKMAQTMMAKALQECPTSGILWAEAIETDPKNAKRSRTEEALKRCGDNPHVVLAVARLFAEERRLEKARAWMERSVVLDPDFGDAWANYYKFESMHGIPEKRDEVARRCVAADPHHGEKWISVAKSLEAVKWNPETILLRVAALV